MNMIESDDWPATLIEVEKKMAEAGDKVDEAMLTVRANVLLEVGRVEDAIKDAEKAVKINENYLSAYMAHARALAYKNKLGAAYEMLKKAWVKDKENKKIQALMEMLDREIKMD